MSRLYLVLLTMCFISCKSQNIVKPDQTIHSEFTFELQKYLGTWYEIARFDHSFERGLQGVTATYSPGTNGRIIVVNQGYKNNLNGAMSKATGKARVSKNGTPRNLQVAFFLNFYAPYNILELDEHYLYALIGSNSSGYLWILSRTPKMDTTKYNLLIEKAKSRGYNTDKLIKVEQPGN